MDPLLKVPAPGAKRPRESSSSTDRVQKELHRIWATPKGAITGWLTVGSRIKRRMKIGAMAIKRGSYSEGFALESLIAGVVVVVESAGLVGNEPVA